MLRKWLQMISQKTQRALVNVTKSETEECEQKTLTSGTTPKRKDVANLSETRNKKIKKECDQGAATSGRFWK